MLVDTAALSAGAEVIDDDDEAVVLDAAVLELALELLESSS
jgi:hypothetical protein